MPVWDTSVASGLRPEGPLFELAEKAALAGEPIHLAAPTVAEISYGLQLKSDDRRFENALRWFTEILRTGFLEVIPVSHEAASLAGRLRAMDPVGPPPTGRRRADGRSKPERRIAWVADIQIAACAWLAGEAICTMDQRHFSLAGRRITQLFPDEGPLEILPAPV